MAQSKKNSSSNRKRNIVWGIFTGVLLALLIFFYNLDYKITLCV